MILLLVTTLLVIQFSGIYMKPPGKCKEYTFQCLCNGELRIFGLPIEERNSSEHSESLCYIDHDQACLDRDCTRFEGNENRSKEMSPELNGKTIHLSHREKKDTSKYWKCGLPKDNTTNLRCWENERELICFPECFSNNSEHSIYYELTEFDLFICNLRKNNWEKTKVLCNIKRADDICGPTGIQFCHEVKKDKHSCLVMCLVNNIISIKDKIIKFNKTFPYFHRYDCKFNGFYNPKFKYCKI